MARQEWTATPGPARGRVLLIHGLSSIADSWWRIGPALAGLGWDVSAVDQGGHGGRPLAGEATGEALADAVLAVHPEAPDVLIGHSLGTVTALALVEREPGWARTVILEEPPSVIPLAVCLGLAESITADVAAVRDDRARVLERVHRECPRWAEEDVYWAVQGIAAMDPEPFARRLRALASGDPPQRPTGERILAAAPAAYVLAGNSAAGVLDGGSVLGAADREALPHGHLIELDGGHCLHRDAPDEWLGAVGGVLG